MFSPPASNSVWRHYKYKPADSDPLNYTYRIKACVFDSEREVVLVQYVPLYVPEHLNEVACGSYVRTLPNFLEKFTQVE